MFLMYVDESGDCGLIKSPTRYFMLTGLVMHELRWQQYLEQLIAFRRRVRVDYGIKLREEIHAGEMLRKPGSLSRIPKHERLAIIREFADELATMGDLSLVNVVVDKQGKPPGYDVFEHSWRALIQRMENTLSRRNFPGPVNPEDRGFIIADQTDAMKLTRLLRRMRRYNPIPSQYGPGVRNLLLTSVIEDPTFRRSDDAFFIQAADLVAFLLYQTLCPNAYMRKKSGQNYFDRLDPILCKVASTSDQRGIVRL